MLNLTSDQIDRLKRLLVTALGAAVVALNGKLGLGMDSTQLGALSAIVIAYVSGSNWKAAVIAKATASGGVAAGAVTTPAGAVAAINGGPQP
jgi:hypothetical protein